jgi:enoyl-[acyl-carrier-protein] reductase (NADH)
MSLVDDPQIRKLHLLDLADPSEIASIAVFLASDVARVITGTTISADCGYGCFKGDVETFNSIVTTPE